MSLGVYKLYQAGQESADNEVVWEAAIHAIAYFAIPKTPG